MSNTGDKWKWGDWVQTRAHRVGLKSKRAFQDAVDVSPRQLDRWLKSDVMPSLHMQSRKMLARVLKLIDVPDEHQIQNMHPEDAIQQIKTLNKDYVENEDINDVLGFNAGATDSDYHTKLVHWHKDYESNGQIKLVTELPKSQTESDKDIRREIMGIMQALSGEYLLELHHCSQEVMKKWLDRDKSKLPKKYRAAGKSVPKRRATLEPPDKE